MVPPRPSASMTCPHSTQPQVPSSNPLAMALMPPLPLQGAKGDRGLPGPRGEKVSGPGPRAEGCGRGGGARCLTSFSVQGDAGRVGEPGDPGEDVSGAWARRTWVAECRHGHRGRTGACVV